MAARNFISENVRNPVALFSIQAESNFNQSRGLHFANNQLKFICGLNMPTEKICLGNAY